MPITHPGTATPYTADADLPPYLIAKRGSITGNCAIAAAATDSLLGVTERVAVPAGQVASICRSGFPPVTYGGTVAAGDYLTSDANGKAIKAVPASGATMQVIGQAEEPGALNDIHPVAIALGQIKG